MPNATKAWKSNVKILDIIEPHQTSSNVKQSDFNIMIRCTEDIMIHAVRLSSACCHCQLRSSGSKKATCTCKVAVNGQQPISDVRCGMENMVKFGKPIPIKGKIIKIHIKLYVDCNHYKCDLRFFNEPCYIQTNVYPLKSEIRDRGVTFTCPGGASPLIGIEYDRYYE